MEKFLEALRGLLADGDGVALATVVARSGSAPRDAGARMLVGRLGENDIRLAKLLKNLLRIGGK